MCGQYHWLFAFIFLCRLIVIRCDSDYCESENEICVERHFYDNADNTSFAFRWIFSEKSSSCRLSISFDVFCFRFKQISNGGWFARFRIRWADWRRWASASKRTFSVQNTRETLRIQIWDRWECWSLLIKYDQVKLAEHWTFLHLSCIFHFQSASVSSNGTMIEEKYENSRWIGHNFSFYHHQVYNGSEFFGWNIELLLPENENHPAFFCRFQSHSNVLKSRINCGEFQMASCTRLKCDCSCFCQYILTSSDIWEPQRKRCR